MKLIKYMFYFILMISVVYFTYSFRTLNGKTNELYLKKSIMSSELFILKNQYKNLKKIDSLEKLMFFKPLKNIKLKNEEKNTTFLQEELSNKISLIYRYFDVNCQTCIIDTLKEMNILIKDKSKLKIIASYQSHRELLAFKRVNQIQTEINNIENNELIEELDLLKTPYLLLVNENMKIISIHILSKEFKIRNRLYVNHIVDLLND